MSATDRELLDTGPCVKCGGAGSYLDRRCGDVTCDECNGHGWFNDGVAGPAGQAPHEFACAVHRGGKCTCSVLDKREVAAIPGTGVSP